MIFVAGQHWFKQQHPLECTRLIQKTATLRTRLAALPVLFFLLILFWVDFQSHLKLRFGGGNQISTQIAGVLSKLRTLGASKLRNRDWVILVNQKKRSSEITYRSQARRAQHLRAQD